MLLVTSGADCDGLGLTDIAVALMELVSGFPAIFQDWSNDGSGSDEVSDGPVAVVVVVVICSLTCNSCNRSQLESRCSAVMHC